MSNINTVIFDLGSVLIGWDPYPVLLKAYNNDEERTRWFLENICHMDWNTTLDAGISFEQAKQERIARYPEYAKYISIYLDNWEDMLLGPIEGTLKILRKLKESGKFKLYAITNWSKEKFPVARKKYPFLSWFDDIVVSGEIGIVKPDEKIYRYAIDRFGLRQPQQAVFIDDRPENIEAAAAFGIKGIHFENPEQMEKELNKLGIHFNNYQK